jgi:hypothetical protein
MPHLFQITAIVKVPKTVLWDGHKIIHINLVLRKTVSFTFLCVGSSTDR